MRWRYAGRGTEGRSRLLDEVCEVCGYERKYAIKLMNRRQPAPKRKAGRKRVYAQEVATVVKAIWLHSEQPCGKRLKELLPLWLPHYQRREGRLGKDVRQQVLKASAATLDRMLSPYRSAHPKRWRVPKPGTLIKTQVPVRTGNADVDRPGYIEADTVAHCGGSLLGDLVWSVNLTDIVTQWTQTRAVWNKGQHGVVAAIGHIEAALPFELLALDTDNGSEFLNWHLQAYLRERKDKAPVVFTRSRPYHKNDNAHIEQKNWTHVRQLVGYDRLGSEACVAPLNVAYEEWNLLQNFFCPTMKLKTKERVGSRYRKQYHRAQTPADRLLEWEHLPQKARTWIKRQQRELDPFELHRGVEKSLGQALRIARQARVDEDECGGPGRDRFDAVAPCVPVALRSTCTPGSTAPKRGAKSPVLNPSLRCHSL